MPFSVVINENFIYVKFVGSLNERTLVELINQVMTTSEYPDKNSVYDFRKAIIEFSGFNLPTIINQIKMLYPKNAKRSKTAIVISSGVQKAVAEIFIDFAKNLPYQLKIFNHPESAEDWVKTI